MPYFGVLPDYSASTILALGPDRRALQNKVQAEINVHRQNLSVYSTRRNEYIAKAAQAERELFQLNSSKDPMSVKISRAEILKKDIADAKRGAAKAEARAKAEDAALAKLTNNDVGLLSHPAALPSQVTPAMAEENHLEMPPLPVDNAQQVADAVDAAQKAAANFTKPGIPGWMYLAGAGVGALLLRKLLK